MRKSWENYRQIYGKSKATLQRNLRTGTPPKLFRTILCFVALVYNRYVFQNSRFVEIIYSTLASHTRQDGVENRDKVYSVLDSLTDYKPVLLLQILSEQSEQILKIKLLSMLNKDNFLNHQDLKQADVNIKNQKIL